MKKLFALLLICLTTHAWATDYAYLTAAYASVEQSFSLATVQKITFEDGQVVVTTSNGTTTIAQSDIERLYFTATATAIVTPEANEKATPATVYDLNGRRVSQPTHGVYIVNGKKVVR